MVGLAVFLDNLHGVRYELKGQQFLRFVAGIINPLLNDVLITQPRYIAKIHPCRKVGEEE